MSDDAPAYGNAWEHVMGPVKNRMLCTWHVNRSWKGKLQKVTNEEIRKTLQDQLFTLRNCSDEVEFQEALPRFLDQKLGKEGEDFLKYFRSHYAGRATQWAHCFRKGIPFTTNNHLEAMHRDLKSNYMHGTHNQRLDKLLMILLELTRDRLYKRLKSLIKGKTNRHATALFQRHQDGMKIPASDVEKLQNGSGWLVKSQSQAGTNYNVERKGDPCQGCILRCKDCDICIDSYQCTCNDSLISVSICKHIHAVAYLERRATTVEEVETQPDMVPSTSCNAAGSTLVDEPQSLLDNIRHSVEISMQKSEPDSEDEVRLALNALNESLSRKKLISASSRAMVVEYLAKAKELVDSAPDASCLKPKVVPHNKKMEKQPRYISTKKRRPGSGSMHVKRPNRLEQQSIMKDLVDNRVSSRVAASTWLLADAAALVLRDHDYCAEQ
ncbi:uncharacterized protein LOC120848424 [Ixodes scapularis]|uniref:uncharacterized protein LOC120848424 n=1 Tax=Ixodes scapularis TaxID=6945 RepID=UPI001A9E41D4|nr:uncharacterized protein LOC120848424 [Ixodes scapularis]